MPTSNISIGTKKKKPLSHTLLAGGIAGFVESSICHPLDTIKTRMQLRNNHIESVGTRLKHSLVEPAVLHMRHSLVEPALRFKHSLSEPSVTAATATLRLKHSLVEPANLIKLRRHSYAEPSLMNLSGVDGGGGSTISNISSVTKAKASTSGGGGSTVVSITQAAITAFDSSGDRGVATTATSTTKLSPTTLTSTRKNNAALCWWNQPRHNHVKTVVADTSNRSFRTRVALNPLRSNTTRRKATSVAPPTKHVVNTNSRTHINNNTAWWNWYKNSSATLAGRGQSSKSAAWWQPTNHFNAEIYGDQHGRRTHVTLSNNSTSNVFQKEPLGPIQTARKIIRKEGFLSLYKGLSAVYVGIVPKMAIRFVSFEHYKDVIRLHTPLGDGAANFTAGLFSGLTEAVLIVTPAEVCKIRMQSQRHSLLDPAEASAGKYGNVVQTAATIIREEGFGALYKGVVPTMLRQGCNQAVNFTAYNAMKKYWLERQRQQRQQYNGFWPGDVDSCHGLTEPYQQLSGTMSLLIGGLSGGMGPLVNNPLDVVKTRLQKQNTKKNVTIAPKYTGLVQACFKIANEEGAGALWKGITPRLLRIVPGQAITFTTYEAICRWL